ncbi:BnaA09g56730D [Brassica napus]|uniref:BnaA09g56730D protein n=1 Tax=Brassica napus TaxID=3708 RepID=A0A078IZF3_BRANA|nr:BnaA09g56730D [Brassica napus]
MSSQKQAVTVRDLVEEAKKRIVILVICVVGLSYLLSLTSSSVWVNLPAAACLIILLRYFSFDVEMKRKAAAYNNKPSSLSGPSLSKPPELPKAAPRSDWRSKVNSQVVEDALDRFTRHLVSEWVLDLWYSRITPDKQGPEELVFIINHVLGELSRRFRNVNLIDLFTRDIIDIICRHVELFRECQAKIERKRRRSLSFEERDSELRRVMATNDKLHPALFSPESEHKVLQHIMDRLISLTFRPEDMHCAFFHYTVRELLACCVMRPVLNLANPRFINERIEAAVMSRTKTNGGSSAAKETSQSEDLSEVSHDHFSRYMDPSVTGVELVQLKHEQKKRKNATDKQHVADLAKDPLLSMDTRSSRSWESLSLTSKIVDDSKYLQGHRGGEGWGDVLEKMSQRKTETLSPEHLESVWAKGRNYKKKEGERVPPRLSIKESCNDGDNARPKNFNENTVNARGSSQPKVVESHLSSYSSAEEDEETKSSHSSTSEDEETVTGLNSPGTRVWDGRTNKNPSVSRIHHPLENSGRRFKQTSKGHERYEKASRHQSSRKRSKRSGLILGDDDSDDSEHDSLARSYSGISATSSASYNSMPESDLLSAPRSSLLVDSFAKLRCEVMGANIVKSSSKMFAVYSISVTDDSNHSWSIKRRFRHFEELHQRLKVFPEYNLYLPPKHFLSTGVDIPVIHERCVLLDTYLKKLLQLPRISGSIEVWDFLSVDSQTYAFSSSFSIIETLTVKPARKTSTVPTSIANMTEATPAPLPSRENLSSENGKSGQHVRNNVMVDDLKSKVKAPGNDHTKTSDADVRNSKENGGLKVGNQAVAMALPGLPTEWVPPKLTLPLLDLVDVVLQLQEGGWIRRKAFWVAKQILQLGMGDALDDWVLEKIRLLRRGTVVASGIQRVEQILWPDGIFMTKHPKRKQQSSTSDEEQQQEAERRAKFVHELMIEKAPATIVSLVGQNEYKQCAEDLYFFLQSSVCLKQLAFDLLELLLLSAFPEMEKAFKQLHEEKHLFAKSIERVGRFLRKSLGSIKSTICFGKHHTVPKNNNSPLLSPFSCSLHRSCPQDSQTEETYSVFSSESTAVAETRDESLINKVQHKKKPKKKKVAEPLEEAKRRGETLAQKMKDFNMVDLRDVEHASDVQEALRCYSSIRSPVYLDIVDNFFTDMYYEFSDPLTITSSIKGSRRKAGSFRL